MFGGCLDLGMETSMCHFQSHSIWNRRLDLQEPALDLEEKPLHIRTGSHSHRDPPQFRQTGRLLAIETLWSLA